VATKVEHVMTFDEFFFVSIGWENHLEAATTNKVAIMCPNFRAVNGEHD
jgi:hypothetical protein